MNNNPKIRLSSKSKLRRMRTKKKKKMLSTIYHQINAKKKIVLKIKVKDENNILPLEFIYDIQNWNPLYLYS